MPIINGSLIDELKISTDATVGNYVELKGDVTGNVRLNRGRRSQDVPSGADAHLGRTRIKGQPSLTIPFRTNSDVTGSWGVLGLGVDTPRAFTMKVGDTRLTGIAMVDDDEDTYDTATALGQFSVTLRPATGQASWVSARDAG